MKNVFVVLFLLITTSAAYAQKIDDSFWTPLFRGVDFGKRTIEEPRIMQMYVLRIDMRAEGVRFYSTPKLPAEEQAKGSETNRQTTVDFLEKNKLQAAVNANFFSLPEGGTMATDGRSNLLGLGVSKGELVSPDEADFVPFCILKDKTPVIVTDRETLDLAQIDTAVAGGAVLMKEGVAPEDILKQEKPEPRTAVGISKDKRYVYFLLIDGRQEGVSEGATYGDLVKCFEELGAWDALNLDGGGSSTMVRADADGKAKILNSPVGRGRPMTLRYNGNSIGVWAQPL